MVFYRPRMAFKDHDQFDFESYVLDLPHKKVGSGEYLLNCPRCKREKLAVNTEKKLWRCFICEASGEPASGGYIKLLKWLNDGDLPQHLMENYKIDSIASVINDKGITLTSVIVDRPSVKDLTPHGLPEGFEPILDHPYIRERGFTPKEILPFGIGVVPNGDFFFANRIIFPVWEDGVCLFFQGRSYLPDASKKVLNPKSSRDGINYYKAHDVLFNYHNIVGRERVAIAEGCFSAIRVGEDCVATFGSTISDKQIVLLYEAGVKIIDFIWDGASPKEPDGAHKKMLAACNRMSLFFDINLIFLPKGDPAEYTREELDRFRNNGKRYEDAKVIDLL